MSFANPLSLLVFPGQFFDADGAPLDSGLVYFYEAGTDTLADTYADVDGNAANTNPVVLDASGFAVIFVLPQLYDVFVHNSDDDSIYSRLGVGPSFGTIYASNAGVVQSQGSKAVVSGYAVVSTDNLITYSGGVGTIQLPAASDRSSANGGNGLPLIIINLGVAIVTIVCAGSDTVNGNANYAMPASLDPSFQSITLVSDGVSSWYGTGGRT